MSDEYEGVEQRKESLEVGKKLSRIETLLEAIEKRIAAQFESVKTWQSDRERECGKLEEDIIRLRIEQAMLGVKVGIGSVVGSAIMAAVVAYFMKR